MSTSASVSAQPLGERVDVLDVVVPDRDLVPVELAEARQRAQRVEVVVEDRDLHGCIFAPVAGTRNSSAVQRRFIRFGRAMRMRGGSAILLPVEFGSRLFVILALSLGPAVSNSFARFAYALLLPAMRNELGLSYSQAGSLNTANALGYLAGSLLTVRTVSRVGNRRLFSIGMVVTVVALIGSGFAASFTGQLVLRAIAGT